MFESCLLIVVAAIVVFGLVWLGIRLHQHRQQEKAFDAARRRAIEYRNRWHERQEFEHRLHKE